jgi:spectinomycin phosphotransferase
MTPWVEGTPGVGVFADRAEAESTAAMLAALHAATPPPGIVAWSPLVPRGFAAELALTLAAAWDRGPYGERARRALDERLESIGGWVARYHRLASVAAERPWVPTHGEPDTGNQLLTASARVLVDWESLRLAPAERDLRTLTGSGLDGLCEPDWAMVELFTLEWRLDEIAGFARWLAAAHDGTRDDQIAYGGLVEELDRADWQRPEQ